MAFTLLFTVEYVLRLIAVRRPFAYARSPLGVIDLLAIAPTWLALIVPGAQFFLTVRVLRLLRIFRIRPSSTRRRTPTSALEEWMAYLGAGDAAEIVSILRAVAKTAAA